MKPKEEEPLPETFEWARKPLATQLQRGYDDVDISVLTVQNHTLKVHAKSFVPIGMRKTMEETEGEGGESFKAGWENALSPKKDEKKQEEKNQTKTKKPKEQEEQKAPE